MLRNRSNTVYVIQCRINNLESVNLDQGKKRRRGHSHDESF